jgi:hypothetical protein
MSEPPIDFEIPPGWVLATLRGGSRDGYRFWVQRPGKSLRLTPEDSEEYVRGRGDVWWFPAPPAVEEPEPEQLTL